ncbi:MAG: hypothetical protein Q8N53_17760 [Longimicrobiales bacterium]|nr:hypothetical protein [Longimicrobiales bacterium]
MSARFRHAPWLLLSSVSACAQGDPPAGPIAWPVRDSAGIAVVENRLDRVPSGAWSVEAAPLLSIGGLDAPASHQLYRVSGATRLPDGRGRVAGGSLLVLVGGGMSFGSDEGFPTGVIRPLSTFGWVGRDGAEVLSGDFPAAYFEEVVAR